MTTNIDNQLNVAPVIDAAKERLQATEQERERVRSIMAIAEQFKDSELANAFVKDGKSVGEYQRSLLDNIHNKQQRQSSHLSDKNGSADLGLSDKEARQFSFVKVLRALAEPTDSSAQRAAAFEFEVSEAAKQSMGKTTERILVPNEVLTRALNAGIDGGAAGNTGGKSIATSLLASSFIDILRNRSTILQVATSLTGLVGNIDIPRQSATSSGGWIGEDVDAPESNLELGQINLTPKTAASHSQITRKLINQSSLDVEALVRDDLAKSLALLIDKAAYYGSGAAGVPRGIANTAGINAVAFAGVNPTFAELVQMETVIAQANADVESMYYVLNPVQRGNAKTATKIPGINGSAIIWEAGNTINGYQSLVSNQINAGDVFFGNFADLLIGMWGGLELHVDPYSQSQKGRIRVTIFQDIDFAVRRTQSFCLGKKV